jgi:multidrug efflux pump subunit AcrB
MKNISAWAIRHPVTPVVLFGVLLVMGLVAFVRLPVTLNPDISFPGVQVLVSQPGASPQEIETQIMQKIEAAVAGIGNIDNITSIAIEGQSRVFIEFAIGTPIDRAVADVRDAVAKIRVDLPQGIQEPVVQRLDIDQQIAIFAVSSSALSDEELSWFVDNSISKRLLNIEGVAQVSRDGGVNREIRVELDPARMQALGITAAQVNQQLRQLNLDSPGGRAQVGGGEQTIRVLGEARSAHALGDTQIVLPGGRFARLSDLATVRDSVGEIRSIARLNGRPATTFSLSKAKGTSDVSVMREVDIELAKIRKENPQVTIAQIFTTVDYTKATYHSAISALLEGSILAVLVVFLFLRDGRATLISALAIPLSAIPTFLVMQWMDFTLNSISLLALSLVAGVLVDDAIVEIENIVRHMRMGKSAFQAALDAADEIGLAVVACSGTIIAVFLPVSFMGGLTGQFFKQFGLTVAAAVFFSLLVARLITPVLAAYTLKAGALAAHEDGPIMAWYQRVLRWSTLHRWKTLAGGLAFFLLSLLALVLVPKAFIPPSDNSYTELNVELPPGGRLEDTAQVSAAAYRILARQPEVASIVEKIGGDDGEVRTGLLEITLVKPSERKASQREFEDRIIGELATIPDARIHFNRNGNGRDVNIYITGDNSQLVETSARKLVEQMREVRELRDPGIDGDMPRPEILIRPHLDLASQLGVTVASLSDTIRIATLGDLDQNSAKFSLADRQVPIRVSLKEDTRRDLSTLENLPVPTAAGGAVPLKAVADITFGEGPTRVRRYNQARRLSIVADLRQGVELGTAMAKIRALPALKNLPQGVHEVDVGNAKYMNELFVNFIIAMFTGILMVFAVLVLLFARVLQPLTILSSLLLSFGGAVAALILTGSALSLGAMIGFLMLMGIVAKNAILLVDFAIEEMRAGKDRLTAIIEATHKRARPIVMTTVAMVAGMVPVAIGLGGDNAFRQPMAVAVIGGLITSTALTLVIVPALFTVVDDIERWLAPKFGRVLTAHHTPTGRPQPHPVN